MKNILFTILLLILHFNIMAQSGVNHQIHPVKINNQWGFISDTGRLVIQPQYDAYAYKKKGYILVEKDKKVGVLDSIGKQVLPMKYQRIRPLERNIFAVVLDTLETVVNEKDEPLLSDSYQYVGILNPQFFTVRIDSLWGIHQRGGRQIAPPIYHQIEPVKIGKGYFIVYQKKGATQLAGLMNTKGKLIAPPKYLDFQVLNDSLFLFKNKDNLWGLLDLDGNILYEAKWSKAAKLNRYLVTVQLKGEKKRTELLSILSRKIIPLKYTYKGFQAFNDTYICSLKGYRKGLLDSIGNEVLKPKFQNIGQTMYPNLFKVQIGSWGLFDRNKDSIVLETINSQIQKFDNQVALFIMGGLYGLVNLKGKTLLPGIYDRIEIVGNVVKTYKKKERNVLRLTVDAELILIDNYAKIKTLRIGKAGKIPNRRSRFFNANRIDRMRIGNYRWQQQNGLYGVFDLSTNQFIVSPRFRAVFPAQEAGVTIVQLNDTIELCGLKAYNNLPKDAVYRTGIFSHNQLQLLPSRKDIIGIRYADFRQGSNVAAFMDTTGRCGLIAPTGRIVAYHSDYQFIGYFKKGLARVYTKGQLLNGMENGFKGNPRLGSTSNLLREYGVGYVDTKNPLRGFGNLLYEGGLWGYLDQNGKMKIAPQFLYADDLYSGQVINRKETGWGIMDSTGQHIVLYHHTKIEDFRGSTKNLFKLQIKSKFITSLDQKGNAIFSKYERQGTFVQGLCRVATRNKNNEIRWGYINQKLEEVIPCRYRQARDFSDDWAVVADSMGWQFIDLQGNVALRLHKVIKDVGNFHDDLAWVKAGSFYGYIDKTGAFVLKPKYNRADDFKFQVARVFINKKATIIDKSGGFVIPANEYNTIKPISEYGLAVVQKKGRQLMGLIDYNGKVVLPPRYDQISQYYNGIATIRLLGKFGFIDSTGKVIVEPQFETVGKPSDGLIAVSKTGKGSWFYIDYRGKKIIPTVFHEASNFSNGFAVVSIPYDTHKFKTALIDKKGKFHYISTESKTLTGFAEGIRNIKEGATHEETGVPYFMHYFTDANNQRLFEEHFKEIFPFDNGVAFVVTIDGWGALNRRGFKIINDKYVRLIRQNETIIRGKAPYLYGFVEKDGTVVHPPIFDHIEYIKKDFYRIERDSKVGYMTTSGKWIWKLKG